jgi:hypothetical protein
LDAQNSLSWFHADWGYAILLAAFTMHILRRHCRPLLFPPGLLALAFLLLLGCGVIRQHAKSLKRSYVLSVEASSPTPLHLFSPLFIPRKPAQMTPEEVAQFRRWQTITFTGSTWPDYFSVRQVQSATRHLRDDFDYDSGLRILFTPHANLNKIAQVLSCFYQVGGNKYWLDASQESLSLFMLFPKPEQELKKQAQLPVFEFEEGFLDGDFIPSPAPAVSQWQLITQYSELHLLLLLSPEWRTALSLLGLLAVVSFSQLCSRIAAKTWGGGAKKACVTLPRPTYTLLCPLFPPTCAKPCSTCPRRKKTSFWPAS